MRAGCKEGQAQGYGALTGQSPGEETHCGLLGRCPTALHPQPALQVLRLERREEADVMEEHQQSWHGGATAGRGEP